MTMNHAYWRRSFGFSARDVSFFRDETPIEIIRSELAAVRDLLDLDKELGSHLCPCACNQGRNPPCYCAEELAARPVPAIAEFPSFADRRTWIVAAVVMLATIGGSWLVDVLRAAQ